MFLVIVVTDRHTDRQTHRQTHKPTPVKHIPSLCWDNKGDCNNHSLRPLSAVTWTLRSTTERAVQLLIVDWLQVHHSSGLQLPVRTSLLHQPNVLRPCLRQRRSYLLLALFRRLHGACKRRQYSTVYFFRYNIELYSPERQHTRHGKRTTQNIQQ